MSGAGKGREDGEKPPSMAESEDIERTKGGGTGYFQGCMNAALDFPLSMWLINADPKTAASSNPSN